VLCRDRHQWVHAETSELVDELLVLLGVDLVDGVDHRTPGTAKDADSVVVGGREAGAAIEDEHHDVCRGDSEPALPLHVRADRISIVGLESAGIDAEERATLPGRAYDVLVTGHPWHVVHDGHATAHQAVEEGGLPDVGPADDCEHGRAGRNRRFRRRRRRGALPSLALCTVRRTASRRAELSGHGD
jgi:hypothetical protein